MSDCPEVTAEDLARLEGQPADVAASAYQYRADREPDANPPEAWLALMHYAGLPLNQPVDPRSPALRAVLCALLWEEIRPLRRLELAWPDGARPQTRTPVCCRAARDAASVRRGR